MNGLEYPRFRWLVLTLAILSFINLQIANLGIATILPQIAHDLNVDMGAATNLMGAFLFAGCIVLIFIGGPVCDRFGAVTTLFLSLIFSTIPATLTPFVGKTYSALLCLRILGGASSGFGFVAMGAIIAVWFPLREKGLASGLMSASVSVGSAMGLIGGSAIYVSLQNWRQTSALLSIAGWVSLVFAIVLLFMKKPALPSTGKEPDKAEFTNAFLSLSTWIGILICFMAAWALQCLYNMTPAFLSADRPIGAGYGPMVSSQFMLAVMITGILGPMLCGILIDKVFRGNTKPIMLTGFILASIFIYALQLSSVNVKPVLLVVCLVLAGLGVQFVYPALFVYLAKRYSHQIVGKMTGLWMGLGTFGGVAGLFLGGITVHRSGNYNLAITFIALAAAVGLVLTIFLAKPKTSV